MPTSIEDRAHGAFLGLAVGDALGSTLEFEERDELPHHAEMLGGPFDLKLGQWADDTSMALALAESLIAARTALRAASINAAAYRPLELRPDRRCSPSPPGPRGRGTSR